MPPIRSPLASISTNRRSNTELTPYQRGEIIGRRATGQSQYQIAAHVGLSRSTIQYTLDHQKSRPDGLSTPRAGHPLKFTARETRSMLRCVRIHPKMAFAERRAHCDTKMSNSHIKNICREAGLTHWRAKKRPELTAEHAYLQLLWARTRSHWDVAMWRRMMFSDECSAERGAGKK